MNRNAMRPVRRSARAVACPEDTKEYLEFELDAATLAQVTALARESHCTPFALCVRLLEESLDRRGAKPEPAGVR